VALTSVIGYIAASLVFAAFCAKRMVPLRMLAIASNIGFISYGSLLGLWPIMLLHCGMLPMNIVRLYQAIAVPDGLPRLYHAVARPHCGLFDAVFRHFARWRERERLRRELAGMCSRDFGDLAVPPGLIADEKRRWPWQPRMERHRLVADGRRPCTGSETRLRCAAKTHTGAEAAFGYSPDALVPQGAQNIFAILEIDSGPRR